MTHVARSRSGPFHLAHCLAVVLAAGSLVAAVPVAAQEVVATPNPDADRLADVVRRLGSAPRDLSALIEAGDLSFALGDATAAAALYKRAEAVDPNNGRVKAGIARILVNGERPGEALRYFEQAQRHGAPMPQYADDRGLAYDLIGEQERAQQDYRLALAQGGREAAKEDEIRRRYALSLGISGRREEALAQIEPLLRRQDRGAWRARAFILAMNGDVSGANKIATSMMPRGMAGGLTAFFQRLPTLSPVDRAFAVHFGEVAPTPARLADARMVPPLTPLAGTPARTQVASVAPTVQPLPTPQKKLSRSEQRRRDRAEAQLAAATTRAPVPVPTPAPTPTPVTSSTPPPTPTPAPAVAATSQPTLPASAPAPAPQVAQVAPVPVTTPRPAPAAPAPVAVAQRQPLPTPTPAPAPQLAAAATTPARPAVTRKAPPLRVSPPRISEDSILARIVAGISVPATELGVAPMPGAQRVPVVAPPAPAAATLDEAAQTAERNAAADEQKRTKLAAAKRLSQKAVAAAEEPEEKPAAKPVDRKARARELAAEKAKKEAAAKEAAEKKAARAEPERIWVQVASGANEGDLPKAWKSAQGKADALAGKRAYTVSNRATNRLVTGPFKTQAEARAMVNTLKKQGLSAFTFTSEAGQKMTKLDGK